MDFFASLDRAREILRTGGVVRAQEARELVELYVSLARTLSPTCFNDVVQVIAESYLIERNFARAEDWLKQLLSD